MNNKNLIDIVFDRCVEFLIYWAKILGITYNEINVYIFCVIWPIFTFLLIAVIIFQRLEIFRLKANAKKELNHEKNN